METIRFTEETINVLKDAINAYRERSEIMKNNPPTIYNFNITVKDEKDAELAAKVITKHFEQKIK